MSQQMFVRCLYVQYFSFLRYFYTGVWKQSSVWPGWSMCMCSSVFSKTWKLPLCGVSDSLGSHRDYDGNKLLSGWTRDGNGFTAGFIASAASQCVEIHPFLRWNKTGLFGSCRMIHAGKVNLSSKVFPFIDSHLLTSWPMSGANGTWLRLVNEELVAMF